MNIIFLTIARINGISRRGIYTDLMRKFRDKGHRVFIVAPRERSFGQPTELVEVDGVHVLGVKTLNLQKTNVIEKGVGQVLVEGQYKRAIMRYLDDVKFDLILYSTPPITFPNVIKHLKNSNPEAKAYLLLKDIFPQNAVDIGMLTKKGIKGLLYKLFRKKEKNMYAISDYIGCMSPANVEYILKHNKEINPSRVEVAPNSLELSTESMERIESRDWKAMRDSVRIKYGLSLDKPIFIYGGNLGKPQGIPFLIKCLNANITRKDCFFIIIGSGTELPKLKEWYTQLPKESQSTVKVMDGLPKKEYDELVWACDAGLIFLDHRFTIPNYPSRLLSYLEFKMPVLCATDPNCDMGKIAEANGYGYYCESNSVEAFTAILDKMIHSDRKAMGKKGYEFLCNNYMVDNTYKAIMSHV